jgi:hypothetical protein
VDAARGVTVAATAGSPLPRHLDDPAPDVQQPAAADLAQLVLVAAGGRRQAAPSAGEREDAGDRRASPSPSMMQFVT